MSDSYQIDIFGNEVYVEQAYNPNFKETNKVRFRRINGYDAHHACSTCIYSERVPTLTGDRQKCVMLGGMISDNELACKKWEKRKEST